MSTTNKLGKHAVVIGGSLSGLMTARVLSDHFAHVTILDRDVLPDAAEHRKGVPQSHHTHGLLASGLRAMDALFPELEAELIRAGAVAGDITGDFRWHQFGLFKAKFNSGLRGLIMSRPLLESTIRARVARLPNVQVLGGCRVRGLLATPEGDRIEGVRFVRRGERDTTPFQADLVVDAAGRGSQSPAWLEALGYERPREEQITIKVGYASRVYRRKSAALGKDIGLVTSPFPPSNRRLGNVVAIEDDRWLVTLGGLLGDHPPSDEAGFLAFARSLPVPDIAAVIAKAEPLSSIAAFAFPANRRFRYERIEQFPDGYLITGDALCSFNPIYGQGMSVAALEATALQAILDEQRRHGNLSGLYRRFFQQAARLIDTPWSMATGADLGFPEVEGKRPFGAPLLSRYMDRLHRVAAHDPVVCRTFFEVVNLLRLPSALFSPPVVLRVLRGRVPSTQDTKSHARLTAEHKAAVYA